MDTDRPRLVYDDDCGFCTWCADWAVRNGEFEPVGFSTLTEEDRDRLPDDYEDCVHLLTDEAVYSCGAATEEVIARTDTVPPEIFDFLNGFSDYERFREDAYRMVADRRDQLGKVVSVDPPVTRRE
jgi:predicted DCC family thiol-disulfide oxidoreductase YuxK